MNRLALILALLCPAAAHAVDDQQLHRAAGASIAAVATVWTGSAVQGFAWGCGANVAKELLDATGMGVADRRDIISGCLGAGIGAGAGRLFVRPQQGGAQLVFSTTF